MIEVRDLKVDYGDTVAVEELCFEVKAGEIYGLIGPNGAGKTTLVNALTGFQKPNRGRIVLGGDDGVGCLEHTARCRERAFDDGNDLGDRCYYGKW